MLVIVRGNLLRGGIFEMAAIGAVTRVIISAGLKEIHFVTRGGIGAVDTKRVEKGAVLKSR